MSTRQLPGTEEDPGGSFALWRYQLSSRFCCLAKTPRIRDGKHITVMLRIRCALQWHKKRWDLCEWISWASKGTLGTSLLQSQIEIGLLRLFAAAQVQTTYQTLQGLQIAVDTRVPAAAYRSSNAHGRSSWVCSSIPLADGVGGFLLR